MFILYLRMYRTYVTYMPYVPYIRDVHAEHTTDAHAPGAVAKRAPNASGLPRRGGLSPTYAPTQVRVPFTHCSFFSLYLLLYQSLSLDAPVPVHTSP